MGDIVTASGTKIYIGSPVAVTAMDTLAEFKTLTSVSGFTWKEVGLVENAGEFGDESASVTGAALGDGRIRKAKGARDAGTQTIVAFHDALDVGQIAMTLAEKTSSNFPFRVVIPDGAGQGAGYSNTTFYYRGLVMGRRKNVGTNDNIIRNTYNVAVNSEVFEDPMVFTT